MSDEDVFFQGTKSWKQQRVETLNRAPAEQKLTPEHHDRVLLRPAVADVLELQDTNNRLTPESTPAPAIRPTTTPPRAPIAQKRIRLDDPPSSDMEGETSDKDMGGEGATATLVRMSTPERAQTPPPDNGSDREKATEGTEHPRVTENVGESSALPEGGSKDIQENIAEVEETAVGNNKTTESKGDSGVVSPSGEHEDSGDETGLEEEEASEVDDMGHCDTHVRKTTFQAHGH